MMACRSLAQSSRRAKITCMHSQTAQIEGGFVLFPKQAPWLDAYLIELMVFPKARHDDQVDSTSQALRWMQQAASEPVLLAFYRALAEEKER